MSGSGDSSGRPLTSGPSSAPSSSAISTTTGELPRKRWRVDELFLGLGVVCVRGTPDPSFIPTEVTLDVDEVTEGALFIARKLWYVDTHTHVEEAIRRGAGAVLVSDLSGVPARSEIPIFHSPHEDPILGLLCDRFYDHPTAQLKVYGVTGTNGKTSTVSYLADLLRASGERVAVIGTVAFSFEDRVLAASNTTPDALVIHRFARDALDLGATALALEVSSHGLGLARVAGVVFDAVGFTSFGRDHLDFHGSLEAYREAKAQLFDRYLIEAIRRGKRPVAVAHDDEEGIRMLNRAPIVAQRIRCQVNPSVLSEAELLAVSPRSSAALIEGESALSLWSASPPDVHGVDMTGRLDREEGAVTLPARRAPLIGDYHPANLAIALGMVTGTHPDQVDQIWNSVAETRGVSGRMERVLLDPVLEAGARGRVALVDYAHTPDAITRALEALRLVHTGPISVLIGCGGDRDRGKRPEMLRAALAAADVVWLTSDNPRSEDPERILGDALEGSPVSPSSWDTEDDEGQTSEPQLHVEVDRRECIGLAWRSLPARGALLITGKGHEEYQEIGTRRYRLSDVEALRAAAWAEHLNCPLRSVSYSHSVRALEVDPPLTLAQLLGEACARRAGLSLSLRSLNDTGDHMHPIGPHQLAITLEGDSSPLDVLLSQLRAELSPRVHHVHVLAPSSEVHALNDELTRCAEELAQLSPALMLRYSCDESRDGESDFLHEQVSTERGGWPKVSRGPKIPSLRPRHPHG